MIIYKEVIEKFDLKVMQLEVTIDDNEPVFNRDIDINEFYEQLKNGANAKTSAVTLVLLSELILVQEPLSSPI